MYFLSYGLLSSSCRLKATARLRCWCSGLDLESENYPLIPYRLLSLPYALAFDPQILLCCEKIALRQAISA